MRARILYTNYRGEKAWRTIEPIDSVGFIIRVGSTEHHPTRQLLMDAYDVDKNAVRTFAAGDIEEWEYLSD